LSKEFGGNNCWVHALKKARKERENTPLSSLSFSLILLENQMGRLLFLWKERKGHKKDGGCFLLIKGLPFLNYTKINP